MFGPAVSRQADQRLRERRARDDWERELPDQYPGLSREALREFLASDRTEACIGSGDLVQSGALNQTIATLGLDRNCYAEIRGTKVFLRRTPAGQIGGEA